MFLHIGVQVLPPPLCPSVFPQFLRRSCLSQNTNNFNTLLLRNRRPHPNRAHCTHLGWVFLTSSHPDHSCSRAPHIVGPPQLERAKQKVLLPKMQTTTRAGTTATSKNAHTSGIICSQLQEQAELLFIGHKQFFPCISPQPTLLFQPPSIKANDFFPSLMGECGDPIFTPRNTGGITLITSPTCSRT